MNTNEISAKTNSRLKRIKTICRSLKIMVLLYFGCFGVFYPIISKTPQDGYWRIFNGSYANFADVPHVVKLMALLGIGICLAVLITGYQLLSLYEKGIIFSGRNIRLLRWIGFLTGSYGLLVVIGPTLIWAWNYWIGVASGIPLNILAINFFALLSSPWVIGGLGVIVLSHIIDEGRKIQEEQELTV